MPPDARNDGVAITLIHRPYRAVFCPDFFGVIDLLAILPTYLSILLLSFAIIAVPTGIVASEMSRAETGSASMLVSTQACPDCRSEGHQAGTRFCKDCGAPMSFNG